MHRLNIRIFIIDQNYPPETCGHGLRISRSIYLASVQMIQADLKFFLSDTGMIAESMIESLIAYEINLLHGNPAAEKVLQLSDEDFMTGPVAPRGKKPYCSSGDSNVYRSKEGRMTCVHMWGEEIYSMVLDLLSKSQKSREGLANLFR